MLPDLGLLSLTGNSFATAASKDQDEPFHIALYVQHLSHTLADVNSDLVDNK
jgi:hypothetical protein